MSRFLNAAALATVLSLVLWPGTTPSRAGPVTDLAVNVTPKPGGLFEYDYALAVEQSSTLGAAQLFLAVSPIADLSAVSAPSGWDISYTPGDPDISFLSSDPSFDIAVGSFGLFSLTSAVGPAPGDFLVRGLDDHTGTFAENRGTLDVPLATVAEPPGLTLGVLASGGVAACSLARRRESRR
jgi:hypothetical protein